jgi:AraC-like DNA-binding protein
MQFIAVKYKYIAKRITNMKTYWVQSNDGTKNKYGNYKYTPSSLARSAFFYLQNIGYFCCTADYYTKREGYGSFLLIYTLNGKGYALYRGKEYRLTKGQVLIMDCYDYQEYRTDTDDLWEFKWIHFNGASSKEYFEIIYGKHGPVIDLGNNNEIPAYIDSIYKLIQDGDRQFEIKVSYIIMKMLTCLLLNIPEIKPGHTGDHNRCGIENVLKLVDERFGSRITLDDMAFSANLSKYHFLRVFKNATGYSPYEYLVKYRINKAKSMLESTSDTIEQIASNVGFESTSNFIRTFKRIEQITPLEYRKYWSK